MNQHNRFSVFNSQPAENNEKKEKIDLNNDSSFDESSLDTTKWRHIGIDKNKQPNFGSFGKKKPVTQKTASNFQTENRKTLLCNNIILKNHCEYGSTCKYAHSLDEQVIEKSRRQIYDILSTNSDLSYINFQENVGLYRGLLAMTKLCDKDKCPGGYNCRHGACRDSNFHICEQDLNYGNCQITNCPRVHLTKRGLKPFWSGYGKITNNTHENIPTGEVRGILLSDGFWKINIQKPHDDELGSNLSLSTDSEECLSNSSTEYEESIFSENKPIESLNIDSVKFVL